MARFVSIGRLERGESPAAAQVEAEPARSGRGPRWRVWFRPREGAIECSDPDFRMMETTEPYLARLVVYRSTAASEVTAMAPGYNKRLCVVAFDRGGRPRRGGSAGLASRPSRPTRRASATPRR